MPNQISPWAPSASAVTDVVAPYSTKSPASSRASPASKPTHTSRSRVTRTARTLSAEGLSAKPRYTAATAPFTTCASPAPTPSVPTHSDPSAGSTAIDFTVIVGRPWSVVIVVHDRPSKRDRPPLFTPAQIVPSGVSARSSTWSLTALPRPEAAVKRSTVPSGRSRYRPPLSTPGRAVPSHRSPLRACRIALAASESVPGEKTGTRRVRRPS